MRRVRRARRDGGLRREALLEVLPFEMCAAAHGLLQGETTFHCRKHASWPDAVQCDRCFKWRAWNGVEIKFRASHAIDATCFP